MLYGIDYNNIHYELRNKDSLAFLIMFYSGLSHISHKDTYKISRASCIKVKCIQYVYIILIKIM